MNLTETPLEGSQCVSTPAPSAAARILFIEDDLDFASVISRILQGAGYRVTEACNGLEASLALDEETPDLILSDINMPGLDGLELLRRVRENPTLASMPVIFLTSLAEAEHAREAMNLGADDFLNKQVGRGVLLQTVKSRLRRAHDYREQCQGRLHRQKDFVSLVAHDLRAPLTAFRLHLDMAALNPSESGSIPLTEMESIFGSMNQMVERLLLMARCQGENIPFEPRWVTLSGLCRQAAALARGYRTPEHTFELRIPTDAQIWVDPVLIEQILCNLLSNAYKYSPQGGVVALSAYLGAKSLRFEVIDRGTGMTPEDAQKLFSAFYRSPRHRHVSGNGIGLFGTKLLVERHGGRIECHSFLGFGTRFTVTLPVNAPSEKIGN